MLQKGYNHLMTWETRTDSPDSPRPKPAELDLDAVQARVLGSLLEKEIATPEYYPLSLNALVNACNQKSNRHPVVALEEQTVLAALDTLRQKHLAVLVSGSEHRVSKYRQTFTRMFQLGPAETAAVCVLLLRGDLTQGEIRTCSGNLYDFPDLAAVETTLQGLLERPDGPLLVRLPRQPGQKEPRYMHLLAGEPANLEGAAATEYQPDQSRPPSSSSRLDQLEEEVRQVRAEIRALRALFDEFRKQFE